MNQSVINSETQDNKIRIKSTMERAVKLIQDPNKVERVKEQECQWCYYNPRMAGQGMTQGKCFECGKDLLFSSTDKDKYCPECAKTNRVCKHCGCDINTKERRSRRNDKN